MKAFISYSHRDAAALERLHVHLAVLKRDKLIEAWFDRDILAGDDLDIKITHELEEAKLFLLLVSPDFLASSYCMDREMKRALERHREGVARVVPIIVQPCEWTKSPLRELKAVPRDGKPISEWTNENNAYLDVAQELRRIVEADAAANLTMTSISNGEGGAPSARRYRVKRDFDQIDRTEFREMAFSEIRSYFKRATDELDGIDDLRGRYRDLSATSFGCVIVNRAKDRGTANLTVHCGGRHSGMGDIYYSFAENAPPNTANGMFRIEGDEFELFLSGGGMMSHSRERDRLTPLTAAEQLWAEFLQQAGVIYE